LVQLRRADSTDVPHIEDFLRDNSLPTVGVKDWYKNFFIALEEKGAWVGVAGYETYGESALLRSVAINEASRNLGHGRSLVETVLADSRKRGIRTVYLLTDTAEAYFTRLGFHAVTRDSIEPEVKTSAEFTECCKTAQVMRRVL